MIYLIYGEERYLVNKKIEEIKSDFEKKNDKLVLGLNYIILNDVESINEIITEIEMPPFGYDRKIIIVRDSGLFNKKKTGLKSTSENSKKDSSDSLELIEYFNNNKSIVASNDIVFLEYNLNKSKLMDYIKKEGHVFNYNALTNRDNMSIIKILEQYIIDFNKKNHKKINISKIDLKYIIDEVGTDLYTLLNNLDMLLFYSFNKETITRREIDKIIIKSTESVIYEISNNILANKNKDIIVSIDKQLKNGVEIYIILGYVYNVFRRIYLIGLAEQNSYNPMGILPANQGFLLPKFRTYIRIKGLNSVEKIMFEIMEIDRLSKIGEINAELGIKALLKQG